MVRRQGLAYDRLFALGAVTVTANLNLNFRRECRQGEVLVITTRPERLGRTSFVLRRKFASATARSPPTASSQWSRLTRPRARVDLCPTSWPRFAGLEAWPAICCTQADGCQPASAQSSPLTAELQIMK